MNHRLTSGPCGERDLILKTKGEGVRLRMGRHMYWEMAGLSKGVRCHSLFTLFLLLMSDHGHW